MPVEQRIQLAPWWELIARFLKLEIYESEVSLELSCGHQHVILSFPIKSLESQTLQKQLSSCKPGAKIALMKTDEATMPLAVRIIEA